MSNSGLSEELDQRIGTAAAHAVRNVPMAKPEERVGSVLDGMRGSTFDSAVVVAVCTSGRLVGLAPIERLLAAPADAVMADVMDNDPPVVAPGTHQERAAWLACKRAEPGLAVVDRHVHFQGLIPPHRLAGILLKEHDEDLDRLGGFLASTADARTASQETVRRRLWHRMPWLSLGLAGAMASAALLAGIEDQMASNLAVAYFIPGIVYLADVPVMAFSILLPYRVLMVWVYDRTQSVLMAALMHLSIIVCAFVLASAAMVGVPGLIFNLVVGATLWVVVAAVTAANRRKLSRAEHARATSLRSA
jgi:hypothetical protein